MQTYFHQFAEIFSGCKNILSTQKYMLSMQKYSQDTEIFSVRRNILRTQNLFPDYPAISNSSPKLLKRQI